MVALFTRNKKEIQKKCQEGPPFCLQYYVLTLSCDIIHKMIMARFFYTIISLDHCILVYSVEATEDVQREMVK